MSASKVKRGSLCQYQTPHGVAWYPGLLLSIRCILVAPYKISVLMIAQSVRRPVSQLWMAWSTYPSLVWHKKKGAANSEEMGMRTGVLCGLEELASRSPRCCCCADGGRVSFFPSFPELACLLLPGRSAGCLRAGRGHLCVSCPGNSTRHVSTRHREVTAHARSGGCLEHSSCDTLQSGRKPPRALPVSMSAPPKRNVGRQK